MAREGSRTAIARTVWSARPAPSRRVRARRRRPRRWRRPNQPQSFARGRPAPEDWHVPKDAAPRLDSRQYLAPRMTRVGLFRGADPLRTPAWWGLGRWFGLASWAGILGVSTWWAARRQGGVQPAEPEQVDAAGG